MTTQNLNLQLMSEILAAEKPGDSAHSSWEMKLQVKNNHKTPRLCIRLSLYKICGASLLLCLLQMKYC